MTEPSQYFKGRTVQEQMNEVIGYVDTRSAEVAVNAIAADVAQVHQDMLDADADAAAAAASAAAAAGTLANAVKKTGEASQSIAGDIAVSGTLSGGVVTGTVITAPAPVNNTDAANKKYVDDADALNAKLTGATFTGVLKAQGQPAYNENTPTDNVATIATLNAYTPMVRTTDYQVIPGAKIFDGLPGACNARNNNVDPNNPPDIDTIVGEWQALGLNNAIMGQIVVVITPSGSTYMNAILRNTDGTYKTVRLATSD